MRRVKILKPCYLIACATLIVVGTAGPLLLGDESQIVIDDGWRRTPEGWERIDSWTTEVAANAADLDYPLSAPKFDDQAERGRCDSHPAALAFAQLLAVGAAFFFFPRFLPRGAAAL
jgi:hypothetical protein